MKPGRDFAQEEPGKLRANANHCVSAVPRASPEKAHHRAQAQSETIAHTENVSVPAPTATESLPWMAWPAAVTSMDPPQMARSSLTDGKVILADDAMPLGAGHR